MSEESTHCLLYVMRVDSARLGRLGNRERRRKAQQLSVILDEACKHRGLDPQTMEPLDAMQNDSP